MVLPDYESANKVCVIRENSAVAMFGTTDVLGRTFEVTIDGITMESTIVGIRQDSASSAISSMLMSFDQVEMEVPLTTMGAAFGYYVDTFQGFYVFTDGPEYAAEAAGAILRLLRSAHHVASDSNSIQMENFNDSMSSITQVLSYITIFVVFVARGLFFIHFFYILIYIFFYIFFCRVILRDACVTRHVTTKK